uniref:ATP-dependent Clp protease proteolytic subunit n=1 Tax=Dvorakia alaica TaxID=2982282 RepID=A0A6M8YYM8_9BRAS|nr:ATP-dependent protease subunit [Iskandera alaica]QKK44042.1 ATP-dependent protease subunit [Iskandera alaica]
MPIGVPKVPFRSPEEEEAAWVDLYNRLYRERIFFIGQEVTSEIANQIMGLMIYFSLEDYTKDLFVFINSPGGGIIPGMGISDTIQTVRADVHTVCVGLAASIASYILVGGTITKRTAFPHARVMMHQPISSFLDIQAGQFILEGKELLKLREKITRCYVQRTGKPEWLISRDLERDAFLSAEDAQAHGIIDLIVDEKL